MSYLSISPSIGSSELLVKSFSQKEAHKEKQEILEFWQKIRINCDCLQAENR